MLREHTGGVAELFVDAAGPASLAQVLESAWSGHRVLAQKVLDETGRIRRHVKVFVDGADVTRGQGMDTEVGPGATVHIINAVSGG